MPLLYWHYTQVVILLGSLSVRVERTRRDTPPDFYWRCPAFLWSMEVPCFRVTSSGYEYDFIFIDINWKRTGIVVGLCLDPVDRANTSRLCKQLS